MQKSDRTSAIARHRAVIEPESATARAKARILTDKERGLGKSKY